MRRLEMQEDHDRAIRDHAMRTFPHECCGFLLGKDEAEVRRISSVVMATNIRDDSERHHRFTITPESFMAADRAARQRKLNMLGFYHSHPNAPARPSQYDLDHAWPIYSYVIVSVRDNRTREMTSWVLRDDRTRFDEQVVTIVSTEEQTRCQ